MVQGEMTMLFHANMTHTANNCPADHTEKMPGRLASLEKPEEGGELLKVKAQVLLQKILPAFVLMIMLATTACATHVIANPTPLPAATVETQIPMPVSPTETLQSASLKQYTNSVFGLSFQYPSNWFGPDEYGSDQTLRVSVGSDKVYPYGELPEKPSEVKNSYLVVIQYSKNGQDQSWKDTYSSLTNLKDGESLPGTRSLIIRVRQLDLGSFKGFEFISTLSETARTDHVYAREVILVDGQSNLLTIFGTPNNVEISNGTDWRDVYRSIDEANLAFFHGIVESIKAQ
jgi:hypothetical protein